MGRLCSYHRFAVSAHLYVLLRQQQGTVLRCVFRPFDFLSTSAHFCRRLLSFVLRKLSKNPLIVVCIQEKQEQARAAKAKKTDEPVEDDEGAEGAEEDGQLNEGESAAPEEGEEVEEGDDGEDGEDVEDVDAEGNEPAEEEPEQTHEEEQEPVEVIILLNIHQNFPKMCFVLFRKLRSQKDLRDVGKFARINSFQAL